MNNSGVKNQNEIQSNMQTNGTNVEQDTTNQINLEHKDSSKSKKLTLKEKMLQKKLKKGSTSFQPNQQKPSKPQAFQSQRQVSQMPMTNQMGMNQQQIPMQQYYQNYGYYPYQNGMGQYQYMQQPQYTNNTMQQNYNTQYYKTNYQMGQYNSYQQAQNMQNPNGQYYYPQSQRNFSNHYINQQQQQQQQKYQVQQQTEQTKTVTQNIDKQTKNIDVTLPEKQQKSFEKNTKVQEEKKQEDTKVVQEKKEDNEKKAEKKQEKEEQKVEVRKEEQQRPQEKVEKQAEQEKIPEVKEESKAVEQYDCNNISEEQIINFIENYTGKLNEEHEYLQFKIIEVEVAKGGKYGRNNKNQKNGNFEVNKPNKNKYKDRQNRDNQRKEQNAPQELARKKVSEETLKKIKEIKENASTWGYMKKNEDEQVQAIKKMKALLNKLTADNFSKVSVQILDCAKNEKIVDPMIENLVRKAWNEPRYTKCYAELVVVLTRHNYSWDKNKKYKTIRKKVLNKVEEEYVEGFAKYQNYAKKIQTSKEYNAQEKKDLLSTKKKQLLGNINFICELYEQKVLNFKIFKMIILYGMYNFIKEYIRTEKQPETYSIKEDYLEALMKIFQNSGHLIEKNETRQIKKKKEENPKFEENSKTRKEIYEDFVYMIKNNDDFTDELMKKEDLDLKSNCVFKISTLFFDFLRFLSKQNLSIRMESLIQNLLEYKESGYTQNIQKISAAKKLSDIQKDIQKQKEKDEEEIQNYYDDNRQHNESYRRDKNYQSFRKKGKYSKHNDNEQYYQKKNTDQYQIKKEMTIQEMKDSIKDFCKENKKYTQETFNKFMEEKLGTNYQKILRAYFEQFAHQMNKDQVEIKAQYPIQLLQENKVNRKQFVNALEKSFEVLYVDQSDLPLLFPALTKILLGSLQEGLLNFEDLNFNKAPQSIQEAGEDELEEYAFFLEDFGRSMLSHQKEYNVSEEDLKKWNDNLLNQ